MKEFSPQQIVDASGAYVVAGQSAGVLFERSTERLVPPTYSHTLAALRAESNVPGGLALRHADLLAKSSVLGSLQYLRVMVAVQGQHKAAYMPGIILPNDGRQVWVGCLASAHDLRPATAENATSRFTDLQHVLLAKIAAEHQVNGGAHAAGQKVNGAEINHAVVVASQPNPLNIHNTVHQLVDSQAFSAKIALTGATNIQTSRGLRVNEEQIFDIGSVAGMVIMSENQVPFPLEGNLLDVSAGFTFAAVRSQVERPQPNLQANFTQLQELSK